VSIKQEFRQLSRFCFAKYAIVQVFEFRRVSSLLSSARNLIFTFLCLSLLYQVKQVIAPNKIKKTLSELMPPKKISTIPSKNANTPKIMISIQSRCPHLDLWCWRHHALSFSWSEISSASVSVFKSIRNDTLVRRKNIWPYVTDSSGSMYVDQYLIFHKY